MKSKIPPQTQVPTEHLSARSKAAWQPWHAAKAAWETQIRQLSETNFVFRTVWEPSYREVWDKRYRALVEVTLRARQAWEGWRRTLESGEVRTFSRVDAAGVSISNEGENWLALLRQVQLSWDLALQELESAGLPNEAFLPGDAQRVIVSVRHHCDEIASTTEKARLTWRTWTAKNRGVTEKTGRLIEKAIQP